MQCHSLGSVAVSPSLDAMLKTPGLAFGLVLEPDTLALAAESCLIALLCSLSFGHRNML